METTDKSNRNVQEVVVKAKNGMGILILNTLAMLAGLAAFVFGIIFLEDGASWGGWLLAIGILYTFIAGPIIYGGLKVLKPNEALVLTLFGKYVGTLKGAGFYFVNPFCTAVNPAAGRAGAVTAAMENTSSVSQANNAMIAAAAMSKRISLKDLTLSNDRQKINDALGNPIIIGIVVIWRVVDTAKAVFNVDNYKEFLSIQCDSALRGTVRLYPYDADPSENERSLRGSSQEVADMLRAEIQSKVDIAGLEIIEARITHLSYAPEIAAAMLQRQQASAIIDARQMIVEGAVGMVEMALAKLSENDIVQLDEERKAAMVSNLLVVLCGNKDAQPVVNSGTLY